MLNAASLRLLAIHVSLVTLLEWESFHLLDVYVLFVGLTEFTNIGNEISVSTNSVSLVYYPWVTNIIAIDNDLFLMDQSLQLS